MSYMVVKVTRRWILWGKPIRRYLGVPPEMDTWGWVPNRRDAWEFTGFATASTFADHYRGGDGMVIVEPFHGPERTAEKEGDDRPWYPVDKKST